MEEKSLDAMEDASQVDNETLFPVSQEGVTVQATGLQLKAYADGEESTGGVPEEAPKESTIGALPASPGLDDDSLFLVQQQGEAKKATGAQLKNFLGGGGPSGPLDPAAVYEKTRPADWLPMPTPEDNEIYLLCLIPDECSVFAGFKATTTEGTYTVETGTVEDGEFVSQSSTTVNSNAAWKSELLAEDFGDLTSDGFKQCMVKISGGEILTFLPSAYCATYIDMSMMATSCTSVYLASNNLRYFSWIGANQITNMSYLFQNCASLTAVLALDTSNATNMSYMFTRCTSLIAIPALETPAVTDMSFMFNECYALTAIPPVNAPSATTMEKMFYGCYSLTSSPEISASSVKKMSNMFYGCHSLEKVSAFDAPSAENMSYMFSGCGSLTTVPSINAPSVTTIAGMFQRCYSLKEAPTINAPSLIDISNLFYECYSLKSVPSFDVSSVTNMYYTFYYCKSLSTVPPLNTQKVTNMNATFGNCLSLRKIGGLDITKVSNIGSAFSGCDYLNSVLLTSSSTITNGISIQFFDCSLGRDAIVRLFQNLPSTTSQYAGIRVEGNPGYSSLTSEDKAIATDKGWSLSL